MMTTRRDVLLWAAVALCAVGSSCSRGGGAGGAQPAAVLDETLIEGTGVGALRIDEATMDDVVRAYGISSPITRGSGSIVEMRSPQVELVFWFVPPPDGQGPPRLYAVRHLLYDNVYMGKTSAGIGVLDSLEAVRAAYGPADADWVATFDEYHYYGQQGVIFTTRHPKELRPELYAKARAALGKEPSEAPGSHVVVGIMVVRPFTVSDPGETMTVRQRVMTTSPKTDLLIAPY
jgi:hypothetical protein